MAKLWTEHVMEYVARFDDGFSSRARGAQPDQIDHLEKLVGRPLPDVYREYLTAFGRDDGGLFYKQRADTRVGAMQGYYRDTRADRPDISFSRVIPIAIGDVFDCYALHDLGDGKLPVIVADEDKPEPNGLLGDSLPEFVLDTAFVLWTNAVGPRASYQFSEWTEENEAAKARARSLGFRVEWFSDSGHVCGVREKDAALLYVNHRMSRPHVSVASPSEELSRALSEEFAKPLGGVFVGVT